MSSHLGEGLIEALEQKKYYNEALEVTRIRDQIIDNIKREGKYREFINKREHLFDNKLNKIILRSYKYFKIKSELLIDYFLKVFLLLYAMMVKSRYGKDIWLVGERPTQAEDNGFIFFEYCREIHPNKSVFYVIDKQSVHVERVIQKGNIIFHSSIRHLAFMIAAKKYISAWTTTESLIPEGQIRYQRLFSKHIQDKLNICLQHGVIFHNISPYLHQKKYKVDYIICSSLMEKEIIKNTLGYKDEQVLITGLSRFDYLNVAPAVNKQILIMPTWRRYLANKSKEEFKKSDFFHAYNSLLNNQELISLLKKQDYKLVFYLHHNFQKYKHTFSNTSDRIEMLDNNDVFVSDLLKSSSLLVTDYSSVASDFVYMNKPVLLYQFDPYHNHHTEVKEIKYRDIGYVVNEEDQLIKYIEDIIMGDVNIELLNNRRDLLFDNVDDQNCSRIYKKISAISIEKEVVVYAEHSNCQL